MFIARAWSKEEIKTLKEMVKTHTWDQIAAHFNCSVKTVGKKAKELNLRKKILYKADPAQDMLIHSISEKRGLKHTAKHLGITIAAVKNSRRRIRNRKEIARQEFSEAGYEKFRKKCFYAAYSKGFLGERAEDFVSWAVVKYLEGRSSLMPKHLIKDYIAEMVGKKGSEHNITRLSMENAAQIVDEYDEDSPGVIVAAPENNTFSCRLLVMADQLNLNIQERLIFLLHYRDGMNHVELGIYFQCTATRIGQILTSIRASFYKNNEARESLAG